jgi:hypothetical protein
MAYTFSLFKLLEPGEILVKMPAVYSKSPVSVRNYAIVDNIMITIPISAPVGIIADPVFFWEGQCCPGSTD